MEAQNLSCDLIPTLEEQAKVRDYYAKGIFRQVWMADKGVTAICEAVSREQMEAFVAGMPLHKAGFMDIEVQELKPFRGFTLES